MSLPRVGWSVPPAAGFQCRQDRTLAARLTQYARLLAAHLNARLIEVRALAQAFVRPDLDWRHYNMFKGLRDCNRVNAVDPTVPAELAAT